MRLILAAFLAIFVSSASAQENRFTLGMHYGVEVYQIGTSCNPREIYARVASPGIAPSMTENGGWNIVLRPIFENLNQICGARFGRKLQLRLIVDYEENVC